MQSRCMIVHPSKPVTHHDRGFIHAHQHAYVVVRSLIQRWQRATVHYKLSVSASSSSVVPAACGMNFENSIHCDATAAWSTRFCVASFMPPHHARSSTFARRSSLHLHVELIWSFPHRSWFPNMEVLRSLPRYIDIRATLQESVP